MKGNQIFAEIFKERSKLFLDAFQNYSKMFFYDPDNSNNLHHAGEFGKYREKIVKDFVKLFVPQRLDVDSGFVINIDDKPSKQIDIVIYDKNETPLIKSEEGQIFYPIETVVSVGEVKSNLAKSVLKTELNNLVEFKKMREKIREGYILYSPMPNKIIEKNEKLVMERHLFDPEKIWCDQISTFLICNKFDFVLKEDINKQINDLYNEGTTDRHKIDFILSLEDGFIGYYNEELQNFEMHTNFETNHNVPDWKLKLHSKEEDSYSHLKAFAMALNNRLSFTSIVKPEIQTYLKEI